MIPREVRRQQAWRLIAALAGFVVVLLLVLAAVEASMSWTDLAAFVQAAILSVTAIIVWWYTKETQRLRKTAERQVAATQRQTGLMLVQAQVSAKSAQLAGYATLTAAKVSPVNMPMPIMQVSVVMRELQELEQKLADRPSGEW